MVRTPWLLEKLRSSDKELEDNEYFMTEKGVGQGDIPSPLLWVAAFDIALTALAMVHSGFKVLDLSSLAVEVSDIAYADDLVSVCASPIVLQEKADIMSNIGSEDEHLQTKDIRNVLGSRQNHYRTT